MKTKNNFITEHFEKEHDRLDQLFHDYMSFKETDLARARECFVAFKFDLQRHIVWEEDILFPILEKKLRIHHGAIALMRQEHRDIITLLELIDKKIQHPDTSSNRNERNLLVLLGQHTLKEESVLYPSLDKFLAEEEKIAVMHETENVTEEVCELCCSKG